MELEDERIGLVLVRASELRSKIANCIHKTQKNPVQDQVEGIDNSNNNGVINDPSLVDTGEETDEEAEALLNICDAFDSLESQLASLQAMQQQQQYEREAVIGDIEYSRKVLLKKLGEYKGEHMDVIREAEVFASMKVEPNSELLLPPYPTRSPRPLVLDNSHISRFSYARKLTQNDIDRGNLDNESKRSQTRSNSNKLWGGLRFLVQSTAKTMLTVVGLVSLLSLAGFEPRLRKKDTDLKFSALFQLPEVEQRKRTVHCPPGKVAVMENGETRCIVKERIEIPFDSVADNPDVNYGCG